MAEKFEKKGNNVLEGSGVGDSEELRLWNNTNVFQPELHHLTSHVILIKLLNFSQFPI